MIRLLRHIFVFIVLGVVTTITVAWACSVWVRVWDVDRVVTGVTSSDKRTWLVTSFVRSGASWNSVKPIWDIDLYNHGRYSQGGWLLNSDAFIDSKIVANPPDPTLPFDWNHYVSARGWPWPALYGETSPPQPLTEEEHFKQLEDKSNSTNKDSLHTERAKPVVDASNRPLPLWPIWNGFVADSGLFTFVWMLIWIVFIPVSRAIRIRGVVFRAIVATLLGVGSTVVVAWGCAWWIDVEAGRTWNEAVNNSKTNDNSTYIKHTQTWGTKRSSSQQRRLPYPLIDSASNIASISDSYGWPMLAMKCSVTKSFNPSTRKHTIRDDKSVLRFDALLGSVEDSPKLPLGIKTGGFAIDSAFFTFAWYLLFGIAAIPIWLRQSRRARHGECIRCGYDQRGNRHGLCTECGEQVRTTL